MFWGKHLQVKTHGTRKYWIGDEEYERTDPDVFVRFFRGGIEFSGDAPMMCAKTKYVAHLEYLSKVD